MEAPSPLDLPSSAVAMGAGSGSGLRTRGDAIQAQLHDTVHDTITAMVLTQSHDILVVGRDDSTERWNALEPVPGDAAPSSTIRLSARAAGAMAYLGRSGMEQLHTRSPRHVLTRLGELRLCGGDRDVMLDKRAAETASRGDSRQSVLGCVSAPEVLRWALLVAGSTKHS